MVTSQFVQPARNVIPIIDLGEFRADDKQGKQRVARAIGDAAESIGFFYVVNHGTPDSTVNDGFSAAKDFFALPLEKKMAVGISESHRGYLPLKHTNKQGVLPDLNESFLVGVDLGPNDPDVKAGTPLHGPNQWPEGQPEIRARLEAYFNAMLSVGKMLLRASALALNLPEEYFEAYYSKPMPFLRSIHYPPQVGPRPANQFGTAEHTDNGFLTLLAQDSVGGLQVKRRDGEWIDAHYIPGSMVINIGDMLMRWTNDRWVSTPHRVINTSGRERYSLPFFLNPTFTTNVSCLETCVSPDHQAKYPPVLWGDYIRKAFDREYAYRQGERSTHPS